MSESNRVKNFIFVSWIVLRIRTSKIRLWAADTIIL
jgi:hypothetical protein